MTDDGTGEPGELLRRELSGVRLLQWTLLVLGLCAGTGLVCAGIHDRVRNTATSPSAALGSLIAGILVTLAALALSALLALRGRDRMRLFHAHGPEGRALAPALHGARRAWTAVSWLGLVLGGLFLLGGLMELSKDGPYEEGDPYVYGALLIWAALLGGAGSTGLARLRRFPRPPAGDGRTPPVTPRGTASASGSASASASASAGARVRRRGSAAPHPVFGRLRARTERLPRGGAVALTVLATLAGCALAAATALLPTHLGNGTFWPLFLATAVFLLAVLLCLFVPRSLGPPPSAPRRHTVLFACTGVGLLVAAGTGFNTAALLDRGEWAETTVTDVRNPAKGSPSCELRPHGAESALDKRLSSCGDLSVGDRVRVFHDPEGEAAPRRERPAGLRGPAVAWGALTSLALLLAVLSSRHHARAHAPGRTPAPAATIGG